MFPVILIKVLFHSGQIVKLLLCMLVHWNCFATLSRTSLKQKHNYNHISLQYHVKMSAKKVQKCKKRLFPNQQNLFHFRQTCPLTQIQNKLTCFTWDGCGSDVRAAVDGSWLEPRPRSEHVKVAFSKILTLNCSWWCMTVWMVNAPDEQVAPCKLATATSVWMCQRKPCRVKSANINSSCNVLLMILTCRPLEFSQGTVSPSHQADVHEW